MYAIIETGGKQYQVKKGDILDVELLEASSDNKILFSHVLFLHDGKDPKVGTPFVSKAKVHAEILEESKGPKVFSFKYKRRKSSTRKKIGHRQRYHRVKITEIKEG